MPLIAGTTTVTAGISAGAGLSKELFDAWRADQGITESPINNTALQQLAKTCNTLASTIVNHIKTNGLVTVSTTDTGTVAAGIPVETTGTAAAQAGATTATGVVTATGSGTGTIS